jgi:hypothetical protein
MGKRLQRRRLRDLMEDAKLKREKEEHERFHVGGTIVLQCRYCRAHHVDFRKMKGNG